MEHHFDIGRRALLAASAPALAATGTGQAAPAPPVRVGRIGLSFYAVTAAVVEAVLVELGHAVERREGTHPGIYPMLGVGEVDMLVASWLPHAHAALHAPVAAGVVEAAILYEEARLYLAVPGFADPAIRAVADLARPDVAAQAVREIVGVAPGSGSARGAEAMLDAYGLRAAGWTLRVGSAAEWTAAIERGMSARRLFAVPAWTPLWTERAFALRPLADPLGVYGGADWAVVLVRRAAWEAWPARSRAAVSRIAIPRAEVAAMDEAVVRGGASADAAARGWIAANRALVAGWLAGA